MGVDAVQIRPFEPADRATVLQALIALQNHEVPLHDSRLPGEATMERYLMELLRDLRDGSGIIFIAEAAGAFVGCVACLVVEEQAVQETPDSNRHGYVSDIFVDPRYRSRGVAQLLLAEAERHLIGTGVTRLRINVLANNAKARRAYERYGLTPYEVMYEKRITRT
jgi:ribosomal protein S18 acetylase RimI-like enzyme